ncbi:unnamed protein product [Mytilus coruscus]|uniref:Uncharacterized protein n=1 Tax=Mytilus coruscus TaxID=42192 RepID=A0A6J8EFE5_MYTCO|nr:unnamed protein product [Mytilus coruscus]
MLNEKITERKDFQDRIESYINHYTQTVNELEFMLEKAKEKYNRTKENIFNTEKESITETKDYVTSLEKRMESELNYFEKKVKEEIKVVHSVKIPFERSRFFGSVIEQKLRGNLLKGPDFKHITSFKTKLKGISKLLPMGNCKAMIASNKEEILQKISFEKSKIKDEQE